MIYFTKHALNKFIVLEKHGVLVKKDDVLIAVHNAELIDHSRHPLIIAQRKFDKTHVLRVVYKQENGIKKIITFYPGRKKHYEEK